MPARSPARTLWPLGLAIALSLFGDLTLYTVLVTQLDVVGLSLAAVGVMLGVNRLIRIPGNPLAGLLIDRRGRRGLFLLGMVLGVISTASYGLVSGFWPFLAARLTWGLAWALLNVAGLAMIVDISDLGNRGRLMGIYNAWVLTGLALGPIVGGFLVDLIGFRPAMLANAAITGAGLLIALIALPETARPDRKPGPGDTDSPAPRPRPTPIWRLPVVARLKENRGLFLAAALYLITQFAADGIVLSTVTLLLQRRFGDSLSLNGLTLGIATAGGLLLGFRSLVAGVFGPLAGHASDVRLGRWPVIGLSLVLGILAFGLLAYATAPLTVLLGVALSALSGGAGLAVLAALVGDLTRPGREGIALGIYATAGDIGSTAGPFLAFALVAVTDLRWTYLLCSVAFIAGLILLWRFQPDSA